MRCNLENIQPVRLDDAVQQHTGDRVLVYKEAGDEKLRLSCFFPPDYAPATRRYPAFFFIHGGGWVARKVFDDQSQWSGDYLGYLARYYADRGFVSVSVDYRLLRDGGQKDGFQLIDLYDDCMDALCFMAARADEYGLDPDKTFLLGESAGGYLAAAMAAFPYRKSPFRFRLAVLVNAITELSENWQNAVPLSSTHPVLAGLDHEERFTALSPVCQVGTHVCPSLMIHGECDSVVKLHHAVDFQKAMRQTGCDSEICWMPDTHHAFLLVEYSKEHKAAWAAIREIDRCIREAGIQMSTGNGAS